MNNYNYGNYNQPTTNVTFVTSLEEALFRASSLNSEMVFFHQDQKIFYRVKVDCDGRKTWAQYNYTGDMNNDNTPVTRAEISELIKKITALEAKINVTENIVDGGTVNE